MKTYITILIFILVTAVCLVFFIIPTFKSLDKMKTDLETVEHDFNTTSINGVNTKELFRNLKIIEQDSEKLNSIYISENRELELITKLEQIADQHSIKQQISMNQNNDKKSKRIKRLTLQVSTYGKFKDLMAYLSDIELLNYYINITNIDVIQNAQDSSGPIALKYSGDIYFNPIK